MTKNLIPWKRGKDGSQLARAAKEEPNPLLALHRQVDDLFDDFFKGFETAFNWPSLKSWTGAVPGSAPSVDVSETESEYQVSADLPGLTEKDVELSLDDDILTIKGEKKQEHEEKKKNYHLMERSYGSFQRVIQLPHGVDKEKVKATFKNGVLNVTLPKTAEAKTSRKVIPVSNE